MAVLTEPSDVLTNLIEEDRKAVPRPISMLGAADVRKFNATSLTITSASGVYIQSSVTKDPIRCVEATIEWDSGLQVELAGSRLTEIPHTLNLDGKYTLVATGEKTTTYAVLEREFAKLRDPNVTLTLESGEKIRWNQIPSSVTAYGLGCKLSYK
jgi:hypothetical protein